MPELQIPDTRIDVLDATGRFAGIGITGELCISGPGLNTAEKPNLTLDNERFSQHSQLGSIYRSGHLGRWNENGNLESLGKRERQFMLTGHRVLPGSSNHPGTEVKGHIPAESPLEHQMVAVWEEVLEQTGIGVGDSFFDLGGHSLKAMRTISRLYQRTGIRVSLRDIFRAETIRELAKTMEGMKKETYLQITPIPDQEDYEVSHIQKRLWIMSQFEESKTAYYITSTFRWLETIDLECLRLALDSLVDRHEILRTVFVEKEGQLRQRVLPPDAGRVTILFRDLEGQSDQENIVSSMIRSRSSIEFNMDRGPLFQLNVARSHAADHLFILTMHHIISDQWSSGLFYKELIGKYQQYLAGARVAPLLLPIQYRDFACWQNRMLEDPQRQFHKQYWLDQLSGDLPVLDLPADHPRPRVKEYRGAHRSGVLDRKIFDALQGLAREEGCSLFTVLLATIKTLLYRYTGAEDIILGIPVAGRDHCDLEDQLGCYINTLAIRTRFRGEKPFTNLLGLVNENLLEAYNHQLYPFDLLVDELITEGDRSRSPLFDVMVNYERRTGSIDAIEKDAFEKDKMSVSTFDLTIHFAEYHDSVDIKLIYDIDLYSQARIERLLQHYLTLLHSICDNALTPLHKLNYIPMAEAAWLKGFNATCVDHPGASTLTGLWKESVRAFGTSTALQFGDRSLTFEQLDYLADRVARILLTRYGIGAGDRVGLLLPRSERLIAGIYGILKTGAAYVPIDPAYPAERRDFIAKDSGAAVLLTEKSVAVDYAIPIFLWEELDNPDEGTDSIVINSTATDSAATDSTVASSTLTDTSPSAADHLAYIIYTSGTTGQPKGVGIRHASVVNLTRWLLRQAYHTNPGPALLTASVNFDASVQQIFAPLFAGSRLVMITEEERTHPDMYIDKLRSEGIGIFDITPSYLHLVLQLLRERGISLPQLRIVLVGGETLQKETVVLFRELFGDQARLINVYGPTETCVDATFQPALPSPQTTPASSGIGKPIDNVQVHVLDNQTQPTGIGITGEIFIAGAGLAEGYWNRAGLTAEKFIRHPDFGRLYRSGDMGRWNAEGELEFLGRRDGQIKIRGYRVELEEIERIVRTYPFFREVLVVAIGDGADRELAAYVVWTADATPDPSTFRDWLAQKLPAYMVPRHVVPLSVIPRTAGGKLDRRHLPAPFDTQGVRSKGPVPPSTDLERQLLAIWQEVLNLPDIGVEDSFFDIGGHSLKAMRMISRLYQRSGIRVSLKDVFRAETIRALAAAMEDMSRDGYEQIASIPDQPDYELSHAQKRLWVLHQSEKARSAYSLLHVYEIHGDIDRTALAMAFDAMVERHEMLRTVFIERDGEPRQKVLTGDELDVRMEFIDLSRTRDMDAKLNELLLMRGKKSFDLEKGPLFKATLLKLSDTRMIFLLNMHHIVIDGWSIDILHAEIQQLYTSFATGLPNNLPPLRIQYRDFAWWQNRMMEKSNLDSHRRYWLDQLGGDLPILELPADYPRPQTRSFRGAYQMGQVPKEVFEALQKLSRETSCSLFTTLLASVNALFHRYSGAEDLIIGIPVAGQEHGDLEGQIGYYVNTLAIRSRIDGKKGFAELLAHVKDNLLEGYTHQLYPFDLLVGELGPATDRSRSPLFDVMVTTKIIEEDHLTSSPENISVNIYRQGKTIETSKYDLTIHFTQFHDSLNTAINYDTDLYTAERIQRMLSHYFELLRGITTLPGQSLGELNYKTPAEQVQIDSFNNTTSSFSCAQTLIQLWQESVKAFGSRPAINFGTASLSYHQLDKLSDDVADCLRHHYGIGPGDRVGLLLQRSERLVAGIYGVLKTGAAYIPIDPAYPPERRAYIAEDSGALVLITETDNEAVIGLPTLAWDSIHRLAEDITAAPPPQSPAPDDLAYIIYTSGSTGLPKGVSVRHDSVVNLTRWLHRLVYARDNRPESALLTASVNFDASVQQLFAPIFAGVPLFIITEEQQTHPDLYIRCLEIGKIASFDITPSYLHLVLQLLKESGRSLPDVRCVLVGGESLQGETIMLFKQVFDVKARLINVYGPTETCVNATFKIVVSDEPETEKENAQTALSVIGKPIDNMVVHVLDNTQGVAGIGIDGELYIGGPGLATGYWNRPELTAEKFILHPQLGRLYRSGDLGRWSTHGELEFFGRKDSQVKIRGYRVELGEIQRLVNSFQGINEAMVTTKGANSDIQLVCYGVWVTPADADIASLRQYLAKKLPAYMVPAYFVSLERLPRTVGGKIDRRSLPQPGQGNDVSARTGVPPATAMEHQLVIIWEEVLEQTGIGVEDNFFESGGHSLKAMRMISKVFQQTGIRVSLRDVFRAETIRGLAREMENMVQEDYEEIQALPQSLHYEVSHVQKRLWILNQFGESRTAYNVLNVYRIAGEFNSDWMVLAFRHLLQRHEILRTVLVQKDGQLRQSILPVDSLPVRSDFHDLTGLGEQHPQVFRVIGDQLSTVFDLEKGPLWRIALIRLGEKQHLGIFTIHHVLTDQWSGGILSNEMHAFYADIAAGREITLPPLRIQYKDFAHWQNQRLTHSGSNHHRKYWLDKFSGGIPILELPLDYPRPKIRSGKGQLLRTRIPEPVRLQLEELAKETGCTMFTVLVAITITLLHRYSGQEDIIVGVPVAGREHGDLENQLGCYVNTLAIRNRFSTLEGFEQLLLEVRENLLDGYAHQLFPFDLLVEELKIGSDRSRNPLFDVMFNYDKRNGKYEIDEDDPLEQKRVATSKFDLVFHFADYKDFLYININYNTDIYSAETIQRMLAHFIGLTEALLSSRYESIGLLDYLSEKETKQLISMSAGPVTEIPRDTTVVQLFESRASDNPEAPAVRTGIQILSYRQLNAEANRLAHYLTDEYSIRSGDTIGVLMDRSPQFIVSLLAILKTGAAYIPIDPLYPDSRIDYMIVDSGLRLIISQQRLTSEKTVPTIYTENQVWRSCSGSNLAKQITPADLAYVIYTSGSTGNPKGVMVEHHSLVNLCSWHDRAFDLTAESRASVYSGIAFDACTWEIWPYLLAGACLFPVEEEYKYQIPSLLQFLQDNAITHSFLPTAVCEEVLQAGLPMPTGWKLLTGGDKLRRQAQQPIELYNNYGPTECTVVASFEKTDPGRPILSIGSPIDNTGIYILDQNLQLLPPGIPGEIYISGEGVARGYINNLAMTLERFLADPFTPGRRMYRSGDWGRWLDCGKIEFIGRKDNQTKIRGFRVELEEIENVMLTHLPEIRQAKVLVSGEDASSKRLLGFYTGMQLSPAVINKTMSGQLPAYMLPAGYFHVPALPLTPNGKISDTALLALAGRQPQAAAHDTHVWTDGEIKLKSLWEDILGVTGIRGNSDFMENGGSSIKAIKLLLEVEKSFGKKLFLRDIYNYSTIPRLAQKIQQAGISGDISIPVNKHVAGLQVQYMFPPLSGIPTVFHPLGSALQGQLNGVAYDYSALEIPGEEVSIHSLAARCTDDIKARHNITVTIRLLGYSMGVWVAYETAVQLSRQGYRVELVLADRTTPPSDKGQVTKEALDEDILDTLLDKEMEAWRSLLEDEQQWRERKQAAGRYLAALQRYHSCQRIIGDCIALEARSTSPGNMKEWAGLVSGQFTYISVHCNHYELLTDPELAEIILSQINNPA